MNYPLIVTFHRDRYPPPIAPTHIYIYIYNKFSWYLLPVYTRALLLFNVPEILPCSLISTTPDFRISQYSSTHIIYFLPQVFFFFFSWFFQALHIIYMYQVYYTVRTGILPFYTHLVHIYVVYKYTHSNCSSMCACTEPIATDIGAVCVERGRPK